MNTNILTEIRDSMVFKNINRSCNKSDANNIQSTFKIFVNFITLYYYNLWATF